MCILATSGYIHRIILHPYLYYLTPASISTTTHSRHLYLYLQDEANNEVIATWGDCRDGAKYNHVDIVQLCGLVDLEAGVDVAGGRGYYLIGAGALLNQAMIQFAISFLYQRGFTPVHTPFFMRKSVMAACAQLGQFDEELYHVSGEGEDKYLIATSEQTLCAMHKDKWFEPKDLPKKLAGYSTCFRKEVGSHGRFRCSFLSLMAMLFCCCCCCRRWRSSTTSRMVILYKQHLLSPPSLPHFSVSCFCSSYYYL